MTTLVCFLLCTRGCGRIRRPAFPAPSLAEGVARPANLGRIAPRECGGVSLRHSERSEAIQLSSWCVANGLLRFARNDGFQLNRQIHPLTSSPDKRANGSRECAPDDKLRERDPGSITTNVRVARSWGGSSIYKNQRWLWVRAFARTTQSGHARGSFLPSPLVGEGGADEVRIG